MAKATMFEFYHHSMLEDYGTSAEDSYSGDFLDIVKEVFAVFGDNPPTPRGALPNRLVGAAVCSVLTHVLASTSKTSLSRQPDTVGRKITGRRKLFVFEN